jgi:acetolactate synthase small subunit
VVVNKIKSGEISHAADIRDKLKVVAMAKEKILKRFVEGEKTLYQSYDSASDQGTNDSCFKKLHAFRGWIVDKDTEETIMELHKELKEKCIFELKKIDQHAEILVKKIKEY